MKPAFAECFLSFAEHYGKTLNPFSPSHPLPDWGMTSPLRLLPGPEVRALHAGRLAWPVPVERVLASPGWKSCCWWATTSIPPPPRWCPSGLGATALFLSKPAPRALTLWYEEITGLRKAHGAACAGRTQVSLPISTCRWTSVCTCSVSWLAHTVLLTLGFQPEFNPQWTPATWVSYLISWAGAGLYRKESITQVNAVFSPRRGP